MAQLLKEKILVVSPTIPRPDMNSGDLRLYSILKILSHEYEITFLSMSYRPGDELYQSRLESIDIIVYVEYSLLKLLNKNKFKLAILEFYYIAEYCIDRIRLIQNKCRIVIDSVDVHFLRNQLKYELTKDKSDYANYLNVKDRELKVYRKADAVITVTRDDASAILAEFPDITSHIVPNTHEVCINDNPPEMNSLIFVGGFSHSPNVDAVLYFCDEIMPLIMKEKSDLKFTIVGSNPPRQIQELNSYNINVAGYVPETTSYLHRSHVSVAPLRYGAGMKGKIGEAMAHGVPVVTTHIGAQGMGLTHRKNIMIADSPRGFAAAVLELLDDRSLYETIKKNALQIIENNYTTNVVGQRMIDVLKRIGDSPTKKMSCRDKMMFSGAYVNRWIKSRLHIFKQGV